MFERSVFINCPFDVQHAPLLEAALFCTTLLGFSPRLANESLENGENRLDKIVSLIRACRFSIHDLSRCKSSGPGEFLRMNMPFEFGLDLGIRRSGLMPFSDKKFLIFEADPYDLKRALSDIAGQDVEAHNNDYEQVIRKVRDFFRVEAKMAAPGTQRIVSEYITFQGWMTEKKIDEGHSERDALSLPTRERLDEMIAWMTLGKPAMYSPERTAGEEPR